MPNPTYFLPYRRCCVFVGTQAHKTRKKQRQRSKTAPCRICVRHNIAPAALMSSVAQVAAGESCTDFFVLNTMLKLLYFVLWLRNLKWSSIRSPVHSAGESFMTEKQPCLHREHPAYLDGHAQKTVKTFLFPKQTQLQSNDTSVITTIIFITNSCCQSTRCQEN